MKKIRIEVPASTANLGPGFDTLGMALDFCDIVTAEVGEVGGDIVLEGCSTDISLDSHSNLICMGYRTWGEQRKVELPGVRFTLQSHIPIGKGLGSSAAAIVAGLAAAAFASGEKNARQHILHIASRMEGHPDNVSAAVLGGLTTAFDDGDQVRALNLVNHLSIGVGLFIPDDVLLTSDARAALPDKIPVRDAVHDLGRLAYLTTALIWGLWECIGPAMENRLHLPYRRRLLPELDTVIEAAKEAGAFGATLSGAGPTVIALGPAEAAERFTTAMERRARKRGWPGKGLVTGVRQHGVQVSEIKAETEGDPAQTS
ncbi:MAG TPA: homoserine kinase [Chloroflexota bacterium]